MRTFVSRRGSALLVVLGMLSFMLFSGLAFSVYLRQQRLPTSFLRRAVTTRQLAKAALAEAMNHLDLALGNDPHPNVHFGSSYPSGVLTNIWSHRVFIGVGTYDKPAWQSQDSEPGTVNPAYASPDSDDATNPGTVPTLTLEGLAYLPPNLINEARYFTQRTPTAKWHSFWFDSGRYAYSVIDVSDYFDVNRVFANKPRASSSGRRISFAHLFENGCDHTDAGTGAQMWDKFMEGYRSVDGDTDQISFGDTPFVSLADFNIAARSQTFGKMRIPFIDFINNGRVYECGGDVDDSGRFTDEVAEKLSLMTFVTDSWYPEPSHDNDGQVFYSNLEEAKYQPFKMAYLEDDSLRPSIQDIAFYKYSDPGMQTWVVTSDNGSRLNQLNFGALWDYLDANSVPVSLCVPTVERTPMIVGVRPFVTGSVELKVTSQQDGSDVQGAQQRIGNDDWIFATRTLSYSLDASALSQAAKGVQVLLTYPFREHGDSDMLGRNFNVDGRLSVFLTETDDNRTTTIPIRPGSFSSYLKKGGFSNVAVHDKSLLSFPIQTETITPQNIIDEKTKSVDGYDVPCKCFSLRVKSGNIPAADLVLAQNVKITWPKTRITTDDEGNVRREDVYPDPDLSKQECKDNMTIDTSAATIGFFPLDDSGSALSDATLKSLLANKDKEIALKANMAVWVRISDSADNTVDLVPAAHQDDKTFNSVSDSKAAVSVGGGTVGCPLLRVVATDDTAKKLTYSLTSFEKSKSVGAFTIPETKWITADPRYNYAPENWVLATSGGDVSNVGELQKEDWMQGAAENNGKPTPYSIACGRDGDVFMSTSDAGYMQSLYELAFLPRVSDGFSDSGRGDMFTARLPTTGFDRADYPTAFSDTKDCDFAWKTYNPFADVSEFVELEDIFEHGGGLSVNPYSDSREVLMAAFANTPHDWRVASTNDDTLFDMDARTYNGKHAWNAYSSDSEGKICWDCLCEFAEIFRDKVHASAKNSETWEDAFVDLDWAVGSGSSPRKLLNSMEDLDGNDSDLYSVDKKFLYGFWHDSFSVRQQLFLIFLRAEPMMVGGGVLGQAPPQLGAHAVALVWRDPTATKGTRTADGTGSSTTKTNQETGLPNPHRMRILFYHMFD